ncbi:hypothetical protein [Butyrivibrio sp. VCD2006]|uniref:hypothetical protein n=1 Tax=Butyrivibrio sp. VCD2006 TaxID=1280664 RepID=UPI00041DDDDD|nr:hypothetical protein [Butyrivibrio sp. VCD2006]
MNIQDINCVARSSEGEHSDYYSCDKYGLKIVLSDEKDDANGFYTDVKVGITNTSKEDFNGVIHLKFMADDENPKFFMPGLMYNTNTADKPSSGRKAFPRIKRNPEGMPESQYFMTRSDRLAEPVSLVFSLGKVKGIAAPPYWVCENGKSVPVSCEEGVKKTEGAEFVQYGGFSCNINDNGKVSVGYTLGYEDAPWLFVQTATVLERRAVDKKNSFCIKAGETIEFSIIIYDYEGEDERAIYRALTHTYECFHEAPRTIKGMDSEKALTLLSGAIRDNAWLEDEKMYSGFVYDREEPRYNKIGSLSWTNGLSVAVPMLFAANSIQDEKARRQSLEFIDNVVRNSFNPNSNLLYDAVDDGKWSVRGWWYNGMHSGGHSAYLNGQAVYYILKAYLSEKNEHNIVHDDWITFVVPVIRKMNSEMNSDHEYPFSFSENTGAGLEYDSMGGAWCLTATALYEFVTGDTEYLDALKKSEQHYYDAYVVKCECYGGPLDTDKAVDDEGILAYVRALRILHEITKEDYLLEHMKFALYYECSFKLSYNTPVSVMPLSKIGWSSCGGSITSTANPHIHPMSSTIIPEMRYYVDASGDKYMKERLEDTVKWSLQTFNTYDKEYGYGEPGWMSERFCFCQGLLTEKYPDGSPASTWFALMPWASASIIEGLAF